MTAQLAGWARAPSSTPVCVDIGITDELHASRMCCSCSRFSPRFPHSSSTPVLGNAEYVLCAGADTRVAAGTVLELLLIITNIWTAVVLIPILKRKDEILALGSVAARLVECTFIAVGLLSLLMVVGLREGVVGADADLLVAIAGTLVALYDWPFLLDPGFVVGIGNGLLLGYPMYRSRFVPRRMALVGGVGGPLVSLSGIAILLGFIEPQSFWQVVATLPEFFWELSLGLWLLFRRFNPAAGVLSLPAERA